MAQTSVIVVSLAVLGALGSLAYLHASRDDEPIVEAPSVTHQAQVKAAPAVETSTPEPVPVQQTTTDDVTRWIADAQSDDAKTRAAAIEALSSAPKTQALPALKRVLESGEPQVDRQIALRSLHILALNDGDSTGAIRDVIRHAVYHSEDEAVAQSAQAFLEDIEAALAERTN